MEGDRSVTMLVQPDQWARCAHDGTSLLAGGGVELDWTDDDVDRCSQRQPGEAAGLAFDRWCLAYRSRPVTGIVEVSGADDDPSRSPCPGLLSRPRGLAVDSRQRLYIAETGAHSVLVVDLWAHRALRRISLGSGRPIDVAADCGQVVALVRRPDCLVRLDGRRGPRPGPALVRPRCHDGLQPMRVTRGPLVLWTGHGYGVVATPDGSTVLEVDGATDLETAAGGVLVVARGPGQPFRRFVASGAERIELEPVGAPDYDGGAIAVTPAGRVAYTVPTGYSTTTGSAAEHATSGSVITYRFDSGAYRTRWGRMFLDACLPPDTAVAARFLTSDLDEVLDPVEPSRPARASGLVPHSDKTPTLPSRTSLDALADTQALFRRPTGREQPWQQIAGWMPSRTRRRSSGDPRAGSNPGSRSRPTTGSRPMSRRSRPALVATCGWS